MRRFASARSITVLTTEDAEEKALKALVWPWGWCLWQVARAFRGQSKVEKVHSSVAASALLAAYRLLLVGGPGAARC